ncbi:HTTM domain-containing protein [Phytoactinopolyspora limicola]|uniref:HTTM domain-containing protein n=1 Tax=Phytoactinopolyspora limicola TaxID=2715536 RepID=UPI001409000E|nr:HTTM domain-containing protein [Phytoactinopolyspora limicola]
MTVTETRRRATFREAAARPVNSASSAFFRIAFGVAMFVNVWLYLPYLVHDYYVDTSFHFSYAWFTFIEPPPGVGIQAVYVIKMLLAVLIAIGLWYRFAIAAFFVLHTYVFLIDSTFFQNHEYLISLVSFFMIFMPLERRWSVDARRRPERASRTVPSWVVWLIRFQFGIVYFYGGVAKLNADWLQGEPLRMWLHRRTDIEIIGPLFEHEPVIWIMTYGSLIFDLAIVWLLLYRRTRVPAFIIATCFHLLNARLFGLYIFPWTMIAATTIYFRPDWPELAWAWIRRRWAGSRPAETAPTTASAPTTAQGATTASAPTAASGTTVNIADPADVDRTTPVTGRTPDEPATRPRDPASTGTARPISRLLAAFLVVWAVVQIVAPLRHYLIPGSPNWTEEAHRFAWHMKLRDKQGSGTFYLTADGRTWQADPSEYLSWKQEFRMYGHPERLARFAHFLSDLHDGAEVRVETSVALNGRARVPLVDPTVDLSSVPLVWWGHADWILPLDEPLRRD